MDNLLSCLASEAFPWIAGLSFLTSLMVTLPCNIRQVSSAALNTGGHKAQMDATPLMHHSAPGVLSTVLLWLILFRLRYFESHKHT